MTMTAPIGVQLYSLRDALAQDFEAVVRQVAAMGYLGVETHEFPGTTPQAAAALFKSLGLQAFAGHKPLPLGDSRQEVLETMAALDCTYLVCPWLDPQTHFATRAQVERVCDLLNEANQVARDHNLTLAYHNHHFEFQPVEGEYPYRIMLERLDPSVVFEIDTYWVKTAGLDPAAIVREMGARAPLLHLKDGPCTLTDPMVAAGEGVMDFPGIISASNGNVQWAIVELDRCATDMLTAVRKSYDYLVSKGLAHGRQS